MVYAMEVVHRFLLILLHLLLFLVLRTPHVVEPPEEPKFKHALIGSVGKPASVLPVDFAVLLIDSVPAYFPVVVPPGIEIRHCPMEDSSEVGLLLIQPFCSFFRKFSVASVQNFYLAVEEL